MASESIDLNHQNLSNNDIQNILVTLKKKAIFYNNNNDDAISSLNNLIAQLLLPIFMLHLVIQHNKQNVHLLMPARAPGNG